MANIYSFQRAEPDPVLFVVILENVYTGRTVTFDHLPAADSGDAGRSATLMMAAPAAWKIIGTDRERT